MRQAGPISFGGYRKRVTVGLWLAHDYGIQLISYHHQNELRFLGIESNAVFIRGPEERDAAKY